MLKSLNLSRPLRIFLAISLAGLLLVNVILLLALDNTPLISIERTLNREDILRAKEILHVKPDEQDEIKTVVLNQKDINIAVSYLLNHFVENTVKIKIRNHEVFCQIAVFMPVTLWGRYLDFSFKLIQLEDSIKIKSFKIGEIAIPYRLANYLLPAIAEHTSLKKYWDLGKYYIQDLQFAPEEIHISYLGSIVDAAKQLVIQKHREYPNLHAYQQQINEIANRHDPNWLLSINELAQPLFLSAYQHSTEATAIQENRAVLIALGSYIYKQELRRYLPLGLVYSKEYQVYAYKRIDIPQHFIASALLAAIDAAVLGEQIGVSKELADAKQGSGFSFIDLLSDHAGTRLGKLAIASGPQARRVQEIMSQAKDYTAYLPGIQGLPEHMNQEEFKLRFGDTKSQTYQDMVAEIDKRINSLAVYQNP